jgi:hypothetical protein
MFHFDLVGRVSQSDLALNWSEFTINLGHTVFWRWNDRSFVTSQKMAAESCSMRVEALACWILAFGSEFGASHELAQSRKFEKALPETCMRMRTKGTAAKTLTSLRRQYANTIRHRTAPKKRAAH